MSLRAKAGVNGLSIRLMEKLRRTDALGILPALQKSQMLTHHQLQDTQLLEVRNHLVFCRDQVPYYSRLFEEIGFNPESFSRPEDLAALPVMTKSTIKKAGTSLRSSAFAHNITKHKSTSGSTGVPLNYYLDFHSHSFLWAHIWRAWGAVGYKPGDIYATLSGGSLLPEKVDLKQKIYLFLSGAIHFPSYHLTEEIMAGYAQRLKREKINYMYGYPSSLELFAEFLLTRKKLDLNFKAVFTTSELLTPKARTTIEAGLSAPVYDTYGCNDGGLYAFECSHHDGWHQNMESCLVEVVDDSGKPLPDGKVGNIVTTHFANKSNPFLRYDTGDMGALDHRACDCGRGLVRIVQIQGRERDFVVTPTGRKVHGAFFNHFEPFYTSDWLDRFQVYQPSQDMILVRIKTNRSPSEKQKEDIISLLESGLDGSNIQLVEVDEFQLTRTGKFRVVISDI